MSNKLSGWIQGKLDDIGWSQNQLARQAGLTKSQISRIVNGKSPSIQEAKSIAHALHVPAESVFRLAGHLPPTPTYNHKAQEMLSIFGDLAEDDQDEILSVVRLKLERRRRAGLRAKGK
jgi:transcriptional regulator with XRE-family HTH domain